MSSLEQIPVALGAEQRETPAPGCQPAAYRLGTAEPVLHEIKHALTRLLGSGEATRIDLRAMPFGPGDMERLLSTLGTGEVEATVDALGPTRVRETAIAGVWLVEYLNSQGQTLALHLEIASIPEILCPQPQDLEDALATLETRLTAGEGDLPLTS